MNFERNARAQGAAPTAHLICGFLGTGKTTFAKQLAAELGAVRFSVDELYLRLFAEGPTYELDAEAMGKLLQTLEQLWPQVLVAGADVVSDFGFWNRKLRDEVREVAVARGAHARLYWVRCPDDIALGRCLQRNGHADAFLISADGFQQLKSHFQPPSPEERAQEVTSTLE